MDDASDRKAPDLRAAMRVARVEEAERSQAVADMRGAELARLEILRDAIEPVLAQIPDDVDLFDTGLVPGPRPRLFVDMIAFVEMASDKRRYRFVQDTRHGRTTLAEADRPGPMVEAIAAYVARRLVQREKALAADPAQAPDPPPPAPSRGARLRRLALDSMGIVALCVLAGVLFRYGPAYWAALIR